VPSSRNLDVAGSHGVVQKSADGLFYAVGEGGSVGLLRPTPTRHELISTFELPQGGQGPVWAHPVVCGGRLYLRHGDYLYAFDVKQK